VKILVLFDVERTVPPDETFSARALREDEDKPTEADVLACLPAVWRAWNDVRPFGPPVLAVLEAPETA